MDNDIKDYGFRVIENPCRKFNLEFPNHQWSGVIQAPNLSVAMHKVGTGYSIEYSWLKWHERREGVWWKALVMTDYYRLATLWDLNVLSEKYNIRNSMVLWGLHDFPEDFDIKGIVVKYAELKEPDKLIGVYP